MSVDNANEPLDEDFPEFMDSLDPDGVYLSGPIRCVEDNGVQWRQELINDYPNIGFNNPLDNHSPEEEEILNDPIHLDENSDKRQVLPSEYVTDDKMQINESDAVLVGLPEVISTGTKMEMMYAYMRGIPIFAWIMDNQEYSGWTFHHAEFVSNDRDEVMNEVKECLKNNG